MNKNNKAEKVHWETSEEYYARNPEDASQPPMIYCARCGERSGGYGTSFWGHVHKYGPTTHKFKPTTKAPKK